MAFGKELAVRKRYSASFYVGGQGETVPKLEEVATVCLRWMSEGRRGLPAEDLPLDPGITLERIDLGENASASMLRVAHEDQDIWGMRLDHADHSQDDLLWRTEICLAQDANSGELAFSCDNLAGSVSQSLVPIERTASRPRIVPEILRRWSGYKGGYSLNVGARLLHAEELNGFAEALLSPSRMRPVVFVSARNENDRPILNADNLADWLAGVAHVVVAANRFPSFKLADWLPERFLCYNGAIRIYWPGLNFNDPYRHRLWVPERIEEIERRHGGAGFREYLLGYVSDIATSVSDPEAPSWALMESVRRQKQIAEAIENGEQAALLALYEEDNVALKAENDEYKTQLADVTEQLRREQVKARGFYSAWVQAAKSAGGAAGERELPEMVADAVDYAEDDFADQLIFALNSKSDGRDSIFEHADEVYSAFKFLATTYYLAKTGEVPCADLDQAARTEFNWRFEANQSKIAMGKYPEWYQCCHEGVVYALEEHLKTGSSKDPRRTMRIAFAWDETLHKVIIGFIGQHQRTDAT